MSKSVKITSFGSQSLHNSTANIKNLQVRDSGPVMVPSLLLTVNSTYYDADGTGANVGIPGQVEVDIQVNGTGSGSLAALDGNILALRLTRGTLTGEDVDGVSLTCTARCVSIPTITTPSMSSRGYWSRYTLMFQQVSNWT